MGFLLRQFTKVVALVTAVALVYTTWRIWIGNDTAHAAYYFSAAAIARSVLLAWLRRADDVSLLFRSKATSFISTPLQEAAFLLPLYAAPAIYAQFGLFDTLWGVPAGWIVLRGIVRFILDKSAGASAI